jgi:hypothetical protein
MDIFLYLRTGGVPLVWNKPYTTEARSIAAPVSPLDQKRHGSLWTHLLIELAAFAAIDRFF